MTCSWMQHVVKFLTGDKWSNWTIEKVPTYRDFCIIGIVIIIMILICSSYGYILICLGEKEHQLTVEQMVCI